MEQNNIYKTVFKVTHSGGSGSCFYLKAYDLFVTNYHVTEGFRTVAIHDNERNPYLAKVVLANPAMDIALLAAEGDFSSLPDISLAEDDTLTIGRKVYVAGYPYGMPFTITEGSVSSPKQLMDGKYYIQTDAAVNPGNSGGPILDEDNRVVGVTVSKFTQADNMGFGIRVETLHALLDTIGDLDRTVFQVQCGSCEELIAEEEEYCPSCGDKLPEGVFEEREQSPLGGFVESAIEQMGVNPVLARDGYDSWLFHKGSSEIRIFVYDNNYLFSTSPINLLPKKEVEPVLDYMLSEDFGPYKLGIEGRQIYIAYRIHLSGGTLRVRILGVFEGGRAVGATRQDKAMPGFTGKPGIALLAPARTNLRHRLRKDACCSYAGAQSHHRRGLRCGIPGRRQCAAFRRNPGYTAPAGGGQPKKEPRRPCWLRGRKAYRLSCLRCSANRSMRCSSCGIRIFCGQCGTHWLQPMQWLAWRSLGTLRS